MTSRTSHLVTSALPILGCFAGGSLYGWSGYLPAVRSHFDVGHAATSMVFSFALASFTLGVLLGPLIAARIAAPFRLAALAFTAALGIGVASIGSGFTGFTIGYGLCFGFMSGALYNYALSQAAASRAPTLLIPVSVAAFGLGGALFGPMSLVLSELRMGLWSTFPALACLVFVAAVSLVKGPSADASNVGSTTTFSFQRPDRNTSVLWVIFFAGSLPGLIVLGFAAQFLPKGSEGMMFASLAVFLAAIGNTLGRLAASVVAARFGPARGVALSLFLMVISLVGLIFATGASAVVTLLFLVAFAYGHLAANTPLLVQSQVGADSFAGTFGWVFTGWGFAGLAGPWTAGWLLDKTGGFSVTLLGCVVLSMFGLWLVTRQIPPSA